MTDTSAQLNQIYAHMLAGNTITDMEALSKFHCRRLASRICDLKASGVPVESKFEYEYDERGKVVRKWKKYWIRIPA